MGLLSNTSITTLKVHKAFLTSQAREAARAKLNLGIVEGSNKPTKKCSKKDKKKGGKPTKQLLEEFGHIMVN